MITTVLVEHPWLSPTALVVLLVLTPVLGHVLFPRPRLAWWLTGLTLVPVVVLTLIPVHRQLYARCTMEWSLPTPGRVESFANVVLFVAPVLLGGLASRRPHWALLAGSVLSAVVEAVQAAVPAIGRSCSSNDWLSNTIGSLIGALLASIALAVAGWSRSRARPPTSISGRWSPGA